MTLSHGSSTALDVGVNLMLRHLDSLLFPNPHLLSTLNARLPSGVSAAATVCSSPLGASRCTRTSHT